MSLLLALAGAVVEPPAPPPSQVIDGAGDRVSPTERAMAHRHMATLMMMIAGAIACGVFEEND